jgi:hypothetical protein
VLEGGTRRWAETGPPQGGSISPLPANLYLHHVFDLWGRRWRKTQAAGDMRGLHDPIPVVGAWLRQVVGGHIRYDGVPMNSPAIALFRFQVGWLWHGALARRSHTGHVAWERMRRRVERWLPLRAYAIPIP